MFRVGQGPMDDIGNLSISERFHSKNAASGQEWRNNLERRVFGVVTNHLDGAIFHMGQNHVLLRLAESMNLIDEQDGLFLVHPRTVPRFRNDTPQVGHTGADGADRLKRGLGNSSYEPGQGGLAAARRSPKDKSCLLYTSPSPRD